MILLEFVAGLISWVAELLASIAIGFVIAAFGWAILIALLVWLDRRTQKR